MPLNGEFSLYMQQLAGEATISAVEIANTKDKVWLEGSI